MFIVVAADAHADLDDWVTEQAQGEAERAGVTLGEYLGREDALGERLPPDVRCHVFAVVLPSEQLENIVPIYDAADRAMQDELRKWTIPVPEELRLALSRAVVGTLRDASMLNYDRPWELDDRFADVLTEAGEKP